MTIPWCVTHDSPYNDHEGACIEWLAVPDDGEGCVRVEVSIASDRIKEILSAKGIYRTKPDVVKTTVRDIAELIAGLAVPVSLGMGSDGLLGTAFEPWKRLYDRVGGGWSRADQIEERLLEVFGFQTTENL